jgi:disulfide bond formation protein DsbB
MPDTMALLRFKTPMTAIFAAVCAGLVGASFFVQHVLLVEPCPLCMVQRYTYALLAVVFAAIALQERRSGSQRALLLAALVLALLGGGVAGYQSQLQLFPEAQAATCSASLTYMLDTLPLGEVVGRLFDAHGDCSDTSFRILGLTLAQISVVIFAVLLVWLVPATRRAWRSKRPQGSDL